MLHKFAAQRTRSNQDTEINRKGVNLNQRGDLLIIGVVDTEVAAEPVPHGIPDVQSILSKWVVNDWLQPTRALILARHSSVKTI